MAARNQDFVVKNGLQVTSNLVVGALIDLPYAGQIDGGAIFTTNVGIGTSTVSAGTRLGVVSGNIHISTATYGLVFSDGSIQRTSAVNAVVPGGTVGSVQYNGGTNFVGSSNLVFDSANVRLGIGTSVMSQALDVYGNVHIGNTATTSGIVFPDGTFQDTAAVYTPSYGPFGTIQWAGLSNAFSGDGTNLYWDPVGSVLHTYRLIAISSVEAAGMATFGDITSDTDIQAVGVVTSEDMIANTSVGIGTAVSAYPLDLYGNLHIGNTATTSGIVFPDGTFQKTAAANTPSFGTVNTVQLAGAANTFSGNSGSLYWDPATLTLHAGNLYVDTNMLVAGNFTVAGTTTFTNVAISSDLIVNSVTSNTFVQAANRITAKSVYANVNVGIGTSTMAYPLDVYGNVHIGNTATTSGIVFPDGTFQTTAVTPTPSYGAVGTLQFAGTANTFSGNGSNLYWDTSALVLRSSNLDVSGYTSVGNVSAIGSILAGSFYSNSNIQAAQSVVSGNVYANVRVGVGTASASYPLDVYGNVHIGNTAAISGLVFPDGTFQTTAAVTTPATPSYGPQYTLQFAGSGNTFSGDGARLFWSSSAASLVAGNATVDNTLTANTIRTNGIIGNVYGYFAQNVTVGGSNASTASSNGALAVIGGAGIGGNLNVGGTYNLFTNRIGIGTTSALGVGNALVTYGGQDVYGNLVISNSSIGGSGIYFPDGTFQSTASYAAALVAGTNKSVQFNDGGTFGGTTTFIYDKATNRVGIGTASATNSLTVYGSSPALFNTTGGSDQQVIVGNTSSDGALLAFNSGAITAYGYIKYVGASLTNIAFTKVGTGIGGITVPINTLDIGGATAIGFAYAGVQNAPGNGLIVQGRVGIATYSPGTNLDINGWASIRQGLSVVGTAWADGFIANTFVTSASINSTGALIAQSINSNTNVVGVNLQSTGQASVDSLVSNTNVVGVNLQSTGLASVDSLVSNTNVVATNLQSTGQASVDSLVVNANSTTSTLNVQNGVIANSINSNTNVVATNLQSTGQASAASLVVNANSTTSTLNVQNGAIANSINSNTNVVGVNLQSTGQTRVASLVVNANSTTSTLNVQNGAIANSINSNTNVVAANVQSTGLASVDSLVVNANSTTSTLNVQNGVIANSINSNTNVVGVNLQSTGQATVASLVSNGSITAGSLTITGLQVAGTTTTNALVSNVYGLFGQNVTVNSTNASTSSATGALVVRGGAGIAGNIVSGGNLVVPLASSLSFVIASNSIVGSSLVSNGVIQSAGTATLNALVSNNNIFGATLNTSGLAQLSSLVVNNNSTTSTLNVQNGVIANSINSNTNVVGVNLQSTGQASAASLVVNANSTTSTLNVQNGAIANSINSNTNVVATNLQSTGQATVASLVSNGAISGTSATFTSLQVSGTTTTNALVSNVYGLFGQNVTISSGNASTSSTSGALVVAGGIGVAGNVTAGGNLVVTNAASMSFITASNGIVGSSLVSNGAVIAAGTVTAALVNSNGTIVGANLYSNGFVQAAGTATVNALISNNNIFGATLNTSGLAQVANLVSNGDVKTATLNTTAIATVAGLNSNGAIQSASTITGNTGIYSNSFVQSAGTVTAALVNSNGTVVGANIYSNGFVQAAGTITAALVNSNGAVVGGSLTSNTTVQAPGNIFGGNVYSNGFVQAAGTITAALVNSNGAVVGSSLTSNTTVQAPGNIFGGNVYSNGFVQAAGTITSNALISNAYVKAVTVNASNNIVGASITSNGAVQAAGLAIVNQLISNANIYGANVNIAGLAYVNDLISNTNITANTLNSKGLTQTANLISNGYTTTATLNVTGNAQVADLTANTVIRTSTITSTGAAIFASISSNGTIQSAGTATVNALIGNNNVFGATLQSSGQALVNSLSSNTTIQSNGAAVFNSFTANTRSFITSGGFAVTGDSLVTGNLTVTGNLAFGGNAFTINTQSLTIVDPIIELGIGSGGTALTIDDGYDRGSYFDYYKNPPFNGETAGFNHAFLGFQSASGRLIYITNVAPGNVNINNDPENYPGIRYGAVIFGNVWLGNGIASTDTATGGVVTIGGAGIGGNINVGGQRSNFTGNVNVGGSNTATSATTGALTVAGGAGIIGNLFVGGNINSNNGAQFSFVTTSNAITTASLFSNGIIQTAGTVTAALVNSNGTVVGGNLYSNGFVQAAGTVTAALVNSNGTIVGANVYSNGFVQSTGTITAALVNSNGTIVGANVYSNGFVQAAGTVTAALVNSNGTIVGANLYSNGFVQAAGTATVNAFYSNTFAQIAGTTTSNVLVSNIYGLFGQNVTINSTNASTSTATGALVLAGGAGIAGNINVGGSRSLFTNRVGVGTTNAFGVGNTLAVYGSTEISGNLVIDNTAAGGSGIYFPDGTFQQTAGTIGGVNQSVQFNDNGLFGGTSTFIFDKTNTRLGIGTASLTNTLMVYGATPALFNTTSGTDQQIQVGNGTSNGATLGFNSGAGTAYGYLRYTGAATSMISFNKTGVGIAGVTIPQNPLEVGGATIIGSAWAGNNNFINPPSNGLSVQGSVGVGTFTPISKLDVRGVGSFTGDLSSAGNVTANWINSNSTMQVATVATVGTLISNVYGLFGQNVTVNSTNASTSTTTGALVLGGGAGIAGNINAGGQLSVFSGNILLLGSNASTTSGTGALIVTNGVGIGGALNVGGQIYTAGVMNAGGTAIVNALTSNGAITGTTINGTSATFTSLQVSGTTTTNALVSNVYGLFGQNVTINSTNAATTPSTGALVVAGGIGVVGNVISNGNLVHAGASSLSFVIASNSIVGSSMTSNGIIQAAGTATVANLVSNGDVKTATLNATSTATVAGLNSNAQVQAAGAVTAAYINSNGFMVGGTINSNGAIQAAGTATVNALTSNGAITGTTINGTSATFTSLQVSGTTTTNALVSNVYGLFGQNVTINSTNASTSTTTGALVVKGGVGIAGNINVGGSDSIFSGRVGIATTVPGAPLGIYANSSSSGSTPSHVQYINAGSQTISGWNFGGTVKATHRVDNGGNMVFNSAANGFYFNNESIGGGTAGTAAFYTNGAAFMTASANIATFPSVVTTTNGSIADTFDGLRLVNPGGASNVAISASITGAIKIKLPTSTFKSNTMLQMTVKIYDYTGNLAGTSRTINLGGYNYSDAAANWVNVYATQLTMGGGDINVRFGNDGTSQCIWIGDTTTVWTYPQILVTDFQGGHSNYTTALWGQGWNVSVEPAYDTVTQGPIVCAKNLTTTGGWTVTGTIATTGTATVNALVSNGAISGTTGTFSSALYSASFNTAGTATVNALVSNGAISGTTGAFSGALTLTSAAPQINLNNGTSNWIAWNTAGVAAPAFTTRSAGTKLVLYPNIGAAATDYALGIEGSTMWFTVDTTSAQYKWYGGTTQAMLLSGAGALTTTSTATSTAFIPSGASVPTNGMFLPAANTLGFSTAGSEELRIASDGNVGINTTTTTNAKLSVVGGTGGSAGELYLNAGTNWMRMGSSLGSGVYNPLVQAGDQALIYSGGTVDTTGSLTIAPWNNTARGMRLDNQGNVSIGTATVFYPDGGRTSLSLNGTSSAIIALGTGGTQRGYVYQTGSAIYLAGTTDMYLGPDSANTLYLRTAGGDRMRISTAGNVAIGTPGATSLAGLSVISDINNSASPLAALDATSLTIRNNSVAGLNVRAKLNFNVATIGASVIAGYYAAFNASNDIGTGLQFATQTNAAGGTVERMRIDQWGNVAIGTASTAAYASPGRTSLTMNGSVASIFVMQANNSNSGYLYAAGTTNQFVSQTGDMQLYVITANPMTFYTNNTERMRIDSAGNVGIATTTIQTGYNFQVQGNAAFTNRVGIGTSAIAGISNALVVYGSAMVYGNINLGNPAGGTSGIYFADGTYQTSAGGTGNYGNTNVASYLSGPVVIGNLTISNTTASTSTTSGALLMGGGAGIQGNVYVGGNIVASSPGATVTQFWASANDTAAQPGYAWSGASNKGMFNAGSGALGFSTAGTERARIDANGNVGIATTSPLAKLDVRGVIQGQSYALPDNGGTAQWIRLGTLTIPQIGYTAHIRAYLHTGYNAVNSQDFYVDIFFKTSNGSSVDASGFAANSWYYSTGFNGTDVTPKWVGNAAGTSATSYDLYLSLPTFTVNSHYVVEMVQGVTWTSIGTLGVADPGVASSTVCIASVGFNIPLGNVGFGTVSPGSKLDVNGISSFRSAISAAGAASVASLVSNANTTTATLNSTGAAQAASFISNTTIQSIGTATVNALVSNGAISGTTGAFSGAITLTGTAPQINLNNGTSNWIAWNTAGVAAPTFTTRSAGTKLVLYPNIGAATADYALGIEGSTLWQSVDTTSAQFKWYGGTTQAALLSGAGALTTTSTTTSTAFIPSGSTVPSNGMYLPAANTVGFATNTTSRMIIDTNGNVGIATSSVSAGYKLQVNGGFAAITKSFVIPHPTKANMLLRHGSLEGPENGVYVRGKTEGTSVIELPDYWWNLVDERTITVHLTPYGRAQEVYVQSASAYTVHLNQPADVYYTVYAERKDVPRLRVEE